MNSKDFEQICKPSIAFTVYGEALTAGNKTPFPIMVHGKPLIKNGRIVTRVKEGNPKTQDWKAAVAYAARQVYHGELLDGPLQLSLTFYRPRPQGHTGSGRNAGKLKGSAPEYPITRPDTVKLTRAIEDALSKVIWKDDSQIVRHLLAKDWGEPARVEICIEVLSLSARRPPPG